MFFSGISHAILICTYDLNDMYGYDYMVLQISENDKLEEEETEPRRKKHTIEAINAMRIHSTNGKANKRTALNYLYMQMACTQLQAVMYWFLLLFVCFVACSFCTA